MKKRFQNNFAEFWFIALPIFLAWLLLTLLHLTASHEAAFLWLNQNGRLAVNDQIWASLTILGDGLVACVLVLPFIRRKPEIVWATLVASLFVLLWVQGLKHFYASPRPLAVLPAEAVHVIGGAYRTNAFPSGHAATAFMLAGILWCYFRGWQLRALLLAIAILVSASRIAVGVHWTSDVLAGMAGGWLSAWVGVAAVKQLKWGAHQTAQLACGVILLLATAVLLGFNHTNYADALIFQRALALICLVAGGYELSKLFGQSELQHRELHRTFDNLNSKPPPRTAAPSTNTV